MKTYLLTYWPYIARTIALVAFLDWLIYWLTDLVEGSVPLMSHTLEGDV